MTQIRAVILALPALLLVATTAPATTPAPAGQDASSRQEAAALDRADLRAQLNDINALLARLDALDAQLVAQARQALERADAAGNLEERARQEGLHTELGARLDALRITRGDIARQLERLDAQLSAGAP
jgi:hypothetical protein